MRSSPSSRRTNSSFAGMVGMGDDLTEALNAFLARHETELIDFRRDLHAHPEPADAADRLARAGLPPVRLPQATGLYVDVGEATQYEGAQRVALRADLYALPVDD